MKNSGVRPESAGAAAAGHNGSVQALAQLGGEFVNFVFAVDLDGLAGGVQNNLAVVALADMGLHFSEELGVDLAVEVVGEFGEEIGAGHDWGPPFFCRK